MVLDHVADRAGLLVEAPRPCDAEALGHGDLHAIDVVAVPDRLQERIGEAEIEQVLHRLLAEIVVDAEDRVLGEDRRAASRLSARAEAVAPERLLDDDAGVAARSRSAECSTTVANRLGRNRQIVQSAAARRRARLRSAVEGRGVAVVAVDVAQQRDELGERLLGRAAAVLSMLSRARARSWSRFQPDFATPITGTSRWPRRAIAWSAGKIFL